MLSYAVEPTRLPGARITAMPRHSRHSLNCLSKSDLSTYVSGSAANRFRRMRTSRWVAFAAVVVVNVIRHVITEAGDL